MKSVLLTGAAGGVGTMLRPLLLEAYGKVLLSHRREMTDLKDGESFKLASLSDQGQLEDLCDGVEGIVHMGGYSVEGPWEEILESNIIGLHNLYEAARKKGVKRIIFASSNHAIGFYERRQKITEDRRGKPDSRYGVSKLFGEGLASMYWHKHGIGTLSIRIGNVGYTPLDHRRLSIYLHPEDLMQLIRIGLEHPGVTDQVVFGNSDCERSWWDNTTAYQLGYKPKWKAEDYQEAAAKGQAKIGPDPIGDLYHGGGFCSKEYSRK